MTPEHIRQRLFLTNPEPEIAEACDRVLSTNSVLKTDVCPVLDANGSPLEKDGIYRYRDKLLKVRRWEFGAGNLLDRYYRVFYTDSDLEDTFFVVNAKYPLGVFSGAVYYSILVRIESVN
jgi:hypothetical protein